MLEMKVKWLISESIYAKKDRKDLSSANIGLSIAKSCPSAAIEPISKGHCWK